MSWIRKAFLYSVVFLGLLIAGVVLQEKRIERLSQSRAQEQAWSYKLGQTATNAFIFGSLVIWGLCWSKRHAD